jgi:hypothetical protein
MRYASLFRKFTKFKLTSCKVTVWDRQEWKLSTVYNFQFLHPTHKFYRHSDSEMNQA